MPTTPNFRPPRPGEATHDLDRWADHYSSQGIDPYSIDAFRQEADRRQWIPKAQRQQQASLNEGMLGPGNNFWFDPRRVGLFHTQVNLIPGPGEELPEWVTPEFQDMLGAAYDYYSDINEGEWWTWTNGPTDDASSFFLSQMPLPPDQFLSVEYDDLYNQFAEGYGAEPDASTLQWSGLTDEEFAALPGWQQALYNNLYAWGGTKIAGPEGEAVSLDPQQYASLPLEQRLLMTAFSDPAVTGASIGLIGGLMGMAGGLVIGSLFKHFPFLQKVGQVLDIPAQFVERSLGTMALMTTMTEEEKEYERQRLSENPMENLKMIFNGTHPMFDILEDKWSEKNRAAMWTASTLFYESMGPPTFHALTEGLFNKPEGDETYLGNLRGALEDITPGHTIDTWQFGNPEEWALGFEDYDVYALQKLTNDILDGTYPPEVLLQKYSAQFGAPGTVTDLMGFIFLDPLNVVAPMANDLLAIPAKMANNTTLLNAISESKGPMEALKKYRGQMSLAPMDDLAKMSSFQRFLAGATDEGRPAGFNVERQVYESITPFGTFRYSPTSFWNKLGGAITPIGPMGIGAAVGSIFGPIGMVALGGVGALKGWKKGFGYLANLTPVAQAVETLRWTTGNIGEIINHATSRAEVDSIVRAVANTPEVVARELSMNTILSHIGATVSASLKDFDWEVLDNLGETFEGLSVKRAIIQNMSEALGMRVDDVLREINKKDTAILLNQYMEKIRQVDTPEAKAILQAFDNGTLNATTLDEVFKVFVKDKNPVNLNEYKAAVVNALHDHIEDWAAKYYDIQKDPTWLRVSRIAKSAQAILLMGWNPTYLVNNFVNNIVTMAYDGGLNVARGPLSIREMRRFWEDVFGFVPDRVMEGVGAEGLVRPEIVFAQGTGAIIEASRGKGGLLNSLQDKVNWVNNKFGVITNASAKIESWSSARIMTGEFLSAFESLWKPGQGYDTMDLSLERALGDGAGLVRDAIVSGRNRKEIEDALFKASVYRPIGAVLDEVAAKAGMTGQTLRQELSKMGVIDDLKQLLDGAKNDLDVANAFDRFIKETEQHLDQLHEATIKDEYNKIVGEMQMEGATAITRHLGRIYIEWLFNRHWDFVENEKAAKAPYGLRSELWYRNFISQDGRHTRWFERFETHLLAFADSVSLGDDRSRIMRADLEAYAGIYRDFYGFKRAEYAKLFKLTNDGAFKTKEEATKYFADMQKRISNQYDNVAVPAEMKYSARIGGYIEDMFALQYGDEVRPYVKEWYGTVQKMRSDMTKEMSKFHNERLKAFEAGQDAPAWQPFVDEVINPMIAQMAVAGNEKLAPLMDYTRTHGGEVKYSVNLDKVKTFDDGWWYPPKGMTVEQSLDRAVTANYNRHVAEQFRMDPNTLLKIARERDPKIRNIGDIPTFLTHEILDEYWSGSFPDQAKPKIHQDLEKYIKTKLLDERPGQDSPHPWDRLDNLPMAETPKWFAYPDNRGMYMPTKYLPENIASTIQDMAQGMLSEVLMTSGKELKPLDFMNAEDYSKYLLEGTGLTFAEFQEKMAPFITQDLRFDWVKTMEKNNIDRGTLAKILKKIALGDEDPVYNPAHYKQTLVKGEIIDRILGKHGPFDNPDYPIDADYKFLIYFKEWDLAVEQFNRLMTGEGFKGDTNAIIETFGSERNFNELMDRWGKALETFSPEGMTAEALKQESKVLKDTVRELSNLFGFPTQTPSTALLEGNWLLNVVNKYAEGPIEDHSFETIRNAVQSASHSVNPRVRFYGEVTDYRLAPMEGMWERGANANKVPYRVKETTISERSRTALDQQNKYVNTEIAKIIYGEEPVTPFGGDDYIGYLRDLFEEAIRDDPGIAKKHNMEEKLAKLNEIDIEKLRDEYPVEVEETVTEVVKWRDLDMVSEIYDSKQSYYDGYKRLGLTSISEATPEQIASALEYWSRTDTENNVYFQRWFMDGAAVDADGKPLMLYHGSKSPIDFLEMSFGEIRDEEGNLLIQSSLDPGSYLGIHLAQEPEVASQFAGGKADARASWLNTRFSADEGYGRVYPVYINVQNPRIFNTEWEMQDFIWDVDLSNNEPFGIYFEEVGYRLPPGFENNKDPFNDDAYDAFIAYYMQDAEHRRAVNLDMLDMARRWDENNYEDGYSFVEEIIRDAGEAARERLQNEGYDGVKYTNNVEGGVSWVAFEPNQVKSIFNPGTWDPNDPTLIDINSNIFRDQQVNRIFDEWRKFTGTAEPEPMKGDFEPVNDAVRMPPGFSDSQDPTGPWVPGMEEMWQEKIKPTLLDAEALLMSEKGKTRGLSLDVDADGRKQLDTYLTKVYGQLSDTKQAAFKWAEKMRDWSLLNYANRTGLDEVMGAVLPYSFWYTRTFFNWWTQRIFDKPQWFARAYRMKRLADEMYQEGFPTRLKGKIRMPIPALPDWTGDAIYFDYYHQVFPFQNVLDTNPVSLWVNEQREFKDEVRYVVASMISSGEITEQQGIQALDTMEGPLWDKIVTTAKMRTEAEMDNPFAFMKAISGPMLPISWAYEAIQGNPADIGLLPITRTFQAVTSLATPGGINLESGFRKYFGLPENGRWSPYQIDRELSNMAGNGEITFEDAVTAMIERAGPIYETAVDRVGKIQSAKTFLGFMWVDIFPEGEAKQRNLKKVFEQYADQGRLTEFWDEHPEYGARLALWDWEDPEARLKFFLRSQIWDKWYDLSKAEQNSYSDAFGNLFKSAFLSSESRSYDSIDTSTMAMWARALNLEIPANEVIDNPPQLKVDLPSEDVVQRLDYFQQMRDAAIPGIDNIISMYYALPEGEARKQMRMYAPQLQQYWDLRDMFIAQNMDLIPYMVSKDNSVQGLTPEQQEIVYQYRAAAITQFPGINQLSAMYRAIPKENKTERRAFRDANPVLYDYWDWQDTVFQEEPWLEDFIYGGDGEGRFLIDNAETLSLSYEAEKINVDNWDDALVFSATGYLFGSLPLSPGLETSLRREWELTGRPGGTFDRYLALLRYKFGLYK